MKSENINGITTNSSDNSSVNLKIIWKKSPDLFFLLFSALIEEGYISTKRHRTDEYKTAKVLYDFFEVIPKLHEKKKYTFNTFYQNIKSSGGLQKEIKHNIHLKNRIIKFIRTLEPESLTLFSK
jgi:hypothetical protein